MPENHASPGNESIEVTEEMIRAGVEVLRASDFGAEIRFDSDEGMVSQIYRAMHRNAREPAYTNLQDGIDSARNDGQVP